MQKVQCNMPNSYWLNLPAASQGSSSVFKNLPAYSSSGGGGAAIGSPVIGGSANSILYLNGSGALAQDPSKLAWNDGSQILTVGSTATVLINGGVVAPAFGVMSANSNQIAIANQGSAGDTNTPALILENISSGGNTNITTGFIRGYHFNSVHYPDGFDSGLEFGQTATGGEISFLVINTDNTTANQMVFDPSGLYAYIGYGVGGMNLGTSTHTWNKAYANSFVFGQVAGNGDFQVLSANGEAEGISFDTTLGGIYGITLYDRNGIVNQTRFDYLFNSGVWNMHFNAADARNNGSPAATLAIGAQNKSAGTGNGGDLILTAGTSSGGNPGNLFIPSMAGSPTATPSTYSGQVAMIVDTTDSKLYAYIGGAWKAVTLS